MRSHSTLLFRFALFAAIAVIADAGCGEKKQEAPATEMMFGVDVIISFVSEFMTLEPGDLIATGTPPGVGPLLPGSTVRVEIAGIGVLENTVIRG